MLESVKLTRFKQFKETEIELCPFTVLTGENNCGKTTVLQAIWLALHGLHQGKLLTVDRRTLQTKVSSTGYYMFGVPFAAPDDLNALFYHKISRGSATYDENSGAVVEVTDEQQNHIRMHMRELFKNLNIKILTPEKELHCPSLQNYEPLYLSAFGGMQVQEERLFPAALEARVSAGDISSNLRNLVLDLKLEAPEKYAYLNRIMGEEFGFQMQELPFYESTERYVRSEYEEQRHGESVSFDFGSCGSGMLQILQTLAAILRYCPEKTRVVLIDEPEAHLHPKVQEKFARTLRELRQKLDIQIIVATHSDTIINEAQPEEIICVSSNANRNKGMGAVLSEEDRAEQRPRAAYEQLSFFDEL